MLAIISHQPGCEVLWVERFIDQTIFHLATGQNLRVGVAPSILEARLDINLSLPPSSLPTDIFCSPFMSRAVWEVVAPIVRTHPEIQRAFDGHPKLQALTRMDYEALRELPLRAYITNGLYLCYPFNFRNRAINPKETGESTDYICAFSDGDCLVKMGKDYVVNVVIDLPSRAVTIDP